MSYNYIKTDIMSCTLRHFSISYQSRLSVCQTDCHCSHFNLLKCFSLGNALLTLDLIIINHFVMRLQPDNHLLELSLRDQVVSQPQ